MIKLKIGIPSETGDGLESTISYHFGRARYYTIIEIEDNKIKKVEVVQTPFIEHGPGDIPNFLKSKGVNLVIAFGMGGRAIDFFNQLGIKVITGAEGKIRDIVNSYLRGELQTTSRWMEMREFRHGRHGRHEF